MFRRKVAGTGGDNDSDKKKILKQLMRRGGGGVVREGNLLKPPEFFVVMPKNPADTSFFLKQIEGQVYMGRQSRMIKYKNIK